MSKSINEWAREVHRLARDKGWHDRPMRDADGNVNVDAVAAKLMLAVSELSEALEELREQPDVLAMYVSPLNGKPEGFDVELADAVIRILDMAEALGLDIEAAMVAKHAYNATRGHRHGNKAL